MVMYNVNQKTACGSYQKNDLVNLQPVQIIARLYHALQQDLVLATKAMQLNDRAAQGEKISHALAIIGELDASLNTEDGGEIAENLTSLYSYLSTELIQANLKSAPEKLENALNTVTAGPEQKSARCSTTTGRQRRGSIKGRCLSGDFLRERP